MEPKAMYAALRDLNRKRGGPGATSGRTQAIRQAIARLERFTQNKYCNLVQRAGEFAALSPTTATHGGRAPVYDPAGLDLWLYIRSQRALVNIERVIEAGDHDGGTVANIECNYFSLLRRRTAEGHDPWTTSREFIGSFRKNAGNPRVRQLLEDVHRDLLLAMTDQTLPRADSPAGENIQAPATPHRAEAAEPGSPGPPKGAGQPSVDPASGSGVSRVPAGFNWRNTFSAIQSRQKRALESGDPHTAEKCGNAIDRIADRVILAYQHHCQAPVDSQNICPIEAYRELEEMMTTPNPTALFTKVTKLTKVTSIGRSLDSIDRFTLATCSKLVAPAAGESGRNSSASSPSGITASRSQAAPVQEQSPPATHASQGD